MKAPRQGGWFKPRHYPHFDFPLSFEAARELATDGDKVARRAFLPLIGYTDIKRTFRTDNSVKALPRSQRPKKVGSKPRDIKYAAHADAAIYSYYAFLLQNAYEGWLEEHDLQSCVIGYRAGLGSNVDLAASVFSEVVERRDVTCLCFDISNFFPSINHVQLKSGLKQVLGVSDLSPPWYNVFKSICNHSWVELKEVGPVLGFDPSDPPAVLVKDINASMKALRGAKLLQSNRGNACGIPQGTPISAVLANVAMAEFDRNVRAWAEANGATYRRYSDDILLIVPPSSEVEASATIQLQASACGSLIINAEKTEISRFGDDLGNLSTDHPLTYLGFTFDGNRVEIRGRTLSRYYRRMTYAVRGTIRGAGRKGQSANFAFKRSLFRDITHLGSSNFYSYATRADKKFKVLNSIVKRQLRRHFQILQRKLKNRGR